MSTINPMWKAYNDLMNEGGEGYNPHEKFVESGAGEPLWSKLEGKAARISRIMEGTSIDDPRYSELDAEYKVLKAAQKDAMSRGL
jgi:hypothetical protein